MASFKTEPVELSWEVLLTIKAEYWPLIRTASVVSVVPVLVENVKAAGISFAPTPLSTNVLISEPLIKWVPSAPCIVIAPNTSPSWTTV